MIISTDFLELPCSDNLSLKRIQPPNMRTGRVADTPMEKLVIGPEINCIQTADVVERRALVETNQILELGHNVKGQNMNDAHQNIANATQHNLVYATYGLHDWIVNNFHLSNARRIDIQIINMTWVVGARMDLMRIINSIPFDVTKFNYTSKTSAIVECGDDVLIELSLSGVKLHSQIHAPQQFNQKFIDGMDNVYPRMASTIHWVYGQHGQTAEVPLNFKPAMDEFYPFLGRPLETFFSEYLESDEAVLILIGPPGTGKTTFIKNLLNYGNSDALVTFDPAIMCSDSLFANFIDNPEIDFLVMEDADTFLHSRSDGNQMMHKFLNVSDGLISSRGKKLVFSTNLPSINDIDDALLRPGRCFRVVEFRNLTNDEVDKLNERMPVNKLPDQHTHSLAELLSNRTKEQKNTTRSMGFY